MLDPAVVAEFRRRAIIEAMAELCAERGYDDTTTTGVAARAGTSRGTLYALYGNKEEIFLDLFDRAAADLISPAEAACASTDGEPQARIEAALAAILDWAAEHPAIAYTILVVAPYATPASLRRYHGVISDLAALLRTAMPARDVSNARREEIIIGGLAAILARRAREGKLEEAPALLADFVGLATAPYLPAQAEDNPS